MNRGIFPEVAVIGMAGKFPMADSIDELWTNLVSGRECTTTVKTVPLDREYIAKRGLLDNSTYFDAGFFDIPPKEAQLTDPQQRLFLTCAWQALEDAGCDIENYDGMTSVYATSGINSYFTELQPYIRNDSEKFQAYMFNSPDSLATRIAHKLNLRGEAITIQTACSSSLVAVHQACMSLITGQSDLALAGGVNVQFPIGVENPYQRPLRSSKGQCSPFDDQADGMVEGDGLAVIVLKRLDDALLDRDHIYGVIKSSAVNNDGQEKSHFSAPSAMGQAEVIATALSRAGVTADTLSYVEAHGTGTAIGDPIEVDGLTQAFRLTTDKKAYCALGSIKANIGHLIQAAGIAGLVKVLLALKHEVLPATAHFKKPNSRIDFGSTPFYVVDKPTAWIAESSPRRAGISSFGVGGTNAHVIVEEVTACHEKDRDSRSHSRRNSSSVEQSTFLHTIILSAKTEKALSSYLKNLHEYLKDNPQTSVGDLAFTLATGRKGFPITWTTSVVSLQELYVALDGAMRGLKLDVNTGSHNISDVRERYKQLAEEHAYFKISLPTYPFELQEVTLPNIYDDFQEPVKLEQIERTDSVRVDLINKVSNLEVREIVREKVRFALGLEKVEDDDDIFGLGMDSLTFVDVLMDCEASLNIEISFETGFNANTINDLIILIQGILNDADVQGDIS